MSADSPDSDNREDEDFENERARDEARLYLLEYLREEFRRHAEVRLRVVPYSRMRPQEDGVVLRTEAREYFFPTDWITEKRFADVQAEIRKIREGMSKLKGSGD